MIGHASAGSANGKHDETTHIVVLAADKFQLQTLNALLDVERDLHGMLLYSVVETSGPYTGQLLALGVEPGPKLERKGYFEHLGLYGR